MKQYTVTGMSCAACQARVEKAVAAVPGVVSVSVSLLTNSMGVEGSADSSAVIRAVEAAGYGASPKGAETQTRGKTLSERIAEEEDALRDRETPVLRRRLALSAGFLLVLMYLSMGHMMWGWPIPAFFEGNHVAVGLAELLLAAAVMVINKKFFVSGFRSLAHRAPNMDTLIALGSSASFVYSTAMLFVMTRAAADGNAAGVAHSMNSFYFETAAMILTLITVGKLLESISKGRTTNALKSLMKLAPKTAHVLRGDTEVTVPADEVVCGDVFVVRPGEHIPADGLVLEGESAVNESALTGESLPVDKAPGAEVTSATLNQSGMLKCRALRVGEDTAFAQIIRMVSDAAATKAPVARLADRISGVFVPAVIGVSLLVLAVWLLTGAEFGYALARAISVLVVSCPCALGLATPVAIMVGNGVGARSGILFKTAEALQETGNIQIAALDKTGTITMGEPRVTDVIPAQGSSREELLRMAGALEAGSEHPLGRAVRVCGEELGLRFPAVSDFRTMPGSGVTGRVEGRSMTGGSQRMMSRLIALTKEQTDIGIRLAGEGKTPLYFAADGKLLGVIAVADTLRPDSAEAIRQLKGQGIHVVMLTGDNRVTAEAIGRQAGVDEVIAGVLPDGKEEVIRRLQEHGKVAMVGDGINDAPALTRADIGIAIGAGTDVAIDAADVVLMKSSLKDVPAAVRVSRATYRNILENLFWALIYNTILIPVAAGAFVWAGLTMEPMLGAAAMSISSFCVVTNALRLNLIRVYDPARDRAGKHAVKTDSDGRLLPPAEDIQEKGWKEMTRTMKIEGMMCPHCEATVRKALEAIDGVEAAVVSHEAGTAVVTLSAEVDNAALTKAVEDRDYKVTGIE